MKELPPPLTKDEARLLYEIVRRSEKEFEETNPVDRKQLAKEITMLHSAGCPLDFNGLLYSRNQDFRRDISGIRYHLNRVTGKLMNNFRPKFRK